MKIHSILSISLLFTAPLLTARAEVGDTIAQAKARYGTPVAEMESKGQTIHVYQTPGGKVTETYDIKGVCVISDADLSVAEQTQPGSLEKPTTENQPALSESKEQATQETLPSGEGKRKRPILLIIIGFGMCIGGIALYIKQKKSEPISLKL